jgi:hypothetical protein
VKKYLVIAAVLASACGNNPTNPTNTAKPSAVQNTITYPGMEQYEKFCVLPKPSCAPIQTAICVLSAVGHEDGSVTDENYHWECIKVRS